MANVVELIIKGDDRSSRAIQTSMKNLESMGSVLGSLKGTLAGLVSVGSLVALGRSALQMGDDLAKASEKLGIGAEKLSAMRYAAELSDVSFESLQKSMKFLSKAITDSQVAGTDAAIAFRAMGISTKDAAGNVKPLNTLFSEVADKFAGMEDGAGKVSLAVALFGRAGMDMIPVLNKGAAGIAALESEARRLGVTISEEQAKKLEEMNDRIKTMGMVAKSTAGNILADLVTSIDSLGSKINQYSPSVEKFFAKIFGGQVSTSDIYSGGEMGDAANLGSKKKSAAPNVGAIKKAKEEEKKLEEEHSKRFMKLLGDRTEGLVAFYGDEAELSKISAEENIKAFEARQKAREEDQKLLEKYAAGQIALLSSLQDAQRAEFEMEGPVDPYLAEDAFAAAEAFGNAALAIEQLNAGFGQHLADLDDAKVKISTYQKMWTDTPMIAANAFGSMASSMQKFATVAGASNSAFFKMFQAFAIAEATISAYAGAARALKDYPWPWSIVVAGVVLAAGLANVAMIASMKPAGAAHGGLDYVPAESTYLLDRGERVLSPRQNEDLTEFLGGGGGKSETIQINLYLDGERLASWMHRASRQGRLNLVPA